MGCERDELVIYAEDGLFVDRLYINDIRFPPDAKYSVLSGRAYVCRASFDRPRRISYADKDGGFWKWREDDTGLVGFDKEINNDM